MLVQGFKVFFHKMFGILKGGGGKVQCMLVPLKRRLHPRGLKVILLF